MRTCYIMIGLPEGSSVSSIKQKCKELLNDLEQSMADPEKCLDSYDLAIQYYDAIEGIYMVRSRIGTWRGKVEYDARLERARQMQLAQGRKAWLTDLISDAD